MKKEVIINGQKETVEVKPITLFYGYDFNLKVPDAVVIDTRESFQIAANLTEEDIRAANHSPIFRACFKTVLRDEMYKLPKDLATFRGEGAGVKAVFVLVMLTLNSIVQNIELFQRGELIINIKYPETCLHPREQANLGDLLIKLTTGRFREIQEEFDLDA